MKRPFLFIFVLFLSFCTLTKVGICAERKSSKARTLIENSDANSISGHIALELVATLDRYEDHTPEIYEEAAELFHEELTLLKNHPKGPAYRDTLNPDERERIEKTLEKINTLLGRDPLLLLKQEARSRLIALAPVFVLCVATAGILIPILDDGTSHLSEHWKHFYEQLNNYLGFMFEQVSYVREPPAYTYQLPPVRYLRVNGWGHLMAGLGFFGGLFTSVPTFLTLKQTQLGAKGNQAFWNKLEVLGYKSIPSNSKDRIEWLKEQISLVTEESPGAQENTASNLTYAAAVTPVEVSKRRVCESALRNKKWRFAPLKNQQSLDEQLVVETEPSISVSK